MPKRPLQTVLRRLLRVARPVEGEVTDADLLAQFVERRDEVAFELLVWRHERMVMGVCLRVLGDLHDAEDAFQATFLALVRKAGSISRRASIGAWLHRVAYRAALRAKAGITAREAREKTGQDLAALARASESAPELLPEELRPLLDRAIDGLPEKYRAAVVLCYLEGNSYTEAGRRLGCPKGTISIRLTRAREMLRKALGDSGFALPASLVVSGLCAQAAFAAAPRELVRLTVETATHFAAGGAASAIPPKVAALTDGVLKAMFIRKLKGIAATAALGLLAAGAVALFVNAGGKGPGDERPPPKAAAAAEPADPLPAGAVARMGTPRLRHEGTITSVAFSPSGKVVASAGDYSALRLWDRATGKELARCVGHQGWIRAVAFAPEGDLLASAGDDGTVRVWDAAGKVMHTLRGHKGIVWCVTFAPNGKLLASGGRDGTVRLWDVATAKEVARLTGHQPRQERPGRDIQPDVARDPDVLSVAFHPDGKRLASGGVDDSVCVWDVETGKDLRHFLNLTGTVSCVAFSPDGKTLAAQASFQVDLWDAATWAPLGRIGESAVSSSFTKFAFAPDSKTIAHVSRRLSALLPEHDRNTVSLYEVATGKEARQVGSYGAPVSGIAFSPDGKTLATGGDYSVGLWDVETGRDASPASGHTSIVRGLAFSPDGKTLATAGLDRTVRLWEPATGREVHRLGGHQGGVGCVAFSPDGRRVASGSREGIGGNSGLSNRERLHPLRVFDPATGRELWSAHANTGGMVQAVAFSPDGKELASLGPSASDEDQLIEFWDAASGELLRRIKGGPGKLGGGEWGRGMAYSPNGKTLAVGGQGEGAPEAWLLDPSTGKVLRKLGEAKGKYSFHFLAFSPDGRTLASGGRDGTVRLWEVAGGREPRMLKCEGDTRGLAFSPDGRTLAAAGANGAVWMWDAVTGEPLGRLDGHRGMVQGVAFSPDGKWLASCGQDTTAIIWKAPAPKR